MLILSISSFLLHAVVLYKGFGFFQLDERCREADKAVVATLMAASVVFMLVQVISWLANPSPPESAYLIHSLWNGVNLFNAIFYWTLIHSYVEHRICRTTNKRKS